ncbi:MAG TPA: response regulator [Planctomycetota bacterium]|nr:response regulator [Planctomycetota bacterium]
MVDPKRVMVVDDSHDTVDVLCRSLEQHGYTAIPAYGGAEAIVKAQSTALDCVLLDIMMPGCDGLEVCRELKSQPATSRLPIIILSAKKEQEDISHARQMGADDYLTKPVGISKLVAAIQAQCARPRPEPQVSLPAQAVVFVTTDSDLVKRTQAIFDASRTGGRDWFRLDVKTSCEVAKATIQANPPRAVIIDARAAVTREAPGLCRQIKMSTVTKNVVVVVLLGNAADDVKYAWANECLYSASSTKLAESVKRHLQRQS